MNYDAEVFEPLHEKLFGSLHADYYDGFHRSKDYESEVDQLREVFAKHGPVRSVVDLGCGTGRHLELLADAGHEVVGVDRSTAMAKRARDRLARFGRSARVVEADLFDVALDRSFDAAIMMFSLLGYQVTNAGVRAALTAMSSRVRQGGLVVFDVMDAAAVLSERFSGAGMAVVDDGERRLLCAHSTFPNPDEQVIEVGLRMWQLDGDRVLDHVDETHLIRYFGPRELELLLTACGLEPVGAAPLAGQQAQGAGEAWLHLVWARKP